ncbi:MAG: Lrp/AsnC family transcriptional regulator [Geminicoccaceae bacterium]
MTMIKLDSRDVAILAILAREGRVSKTELARRVNLSATPCWERIRRLQQAGVVTGYHAQIALKSITAHVELFVIVELEHHRAEAFAMFERAVLAVDEITGCWALGGGFDYLLRVITRDIDAYQRLIDDLLGQKIGLARYFTYIVTKSVKSGPPPLGALLQAGE